ncbi:MAG: hypothetical protein LBN43_09275, partial [Oscillospiraceae bacterium]|nr:hypothetical protein [Oscillospiraceae bacterium]
PMFHGNKSNGITAPDSRAVIAPRIRVTNHAEFCIRITKHAKSESTANPSDIDNNKQITNHPDTGTMFTPNSDRINVIGALNRASSGSQPPIVRIAI